MDFMRLRVRLDVCLPLKKGKVIILPGGVSTMVTFKFEKLPNFCFICGLLEHVERFFIVIRRNNWDNSAILRAWGFIFVLR